MTRTRRLGPGVDALLRPQQKTATTQTSEQGELRDIALDQLRPSPYQPRTEFDPDAIKTLAASLKESGTIQPIVVRRVGSQYEIIAGERRLRAAQEAGLDSLPAIVRQLSDDEAATLTLIENIQREDLNPIDEAKALDRLTQQLDCTHEQVAEQVGRARATVTNLIRLLKLDSSVQTLVADGQISMGHARILIPLNKARQQTLAQKTIREDLSVRALEQLTKAKGSSPGPRPDQDPDTLKLQQQLSDLMGCAVVLKTNKRGGGQLVLSYNSSESLQGVLQKFGYEAE